MRVIALLIFLFLCSSLCNASVDDSLPPGKTSRLLAFPFILRSPETSWGFGGVAAYFFKSQKQEKKLRTSDVNLISLYTLKEQLVIVLGSTIFFSEEKKIFRFQTSYSFYPDKFWGLGNNTPEKNKQDFSLKQTFFNPQLLFNVYKNLYVGASIELQNIADFRYIENGIIDEQKIIGRDGGFTSGVGALITWDTRNNAYSPSKGFFAELNSTNFSKLTGSDFIFTYYAVDIRTFLPLGRNRVLGFQSFSRFSQDQVPIRYLSMLGGPEIMRGYYKGRYTSQNMTALQAELRQYLFWRLGVVGFVSTGQVSDSFKNFKLNEFHHAYGFGLRLMVQEKENLNLRVDFGFGKNSSGIYVILKEAF
jgi:outer membrane protein assembly factor BamA